MFIPKTEVNSLPSMVNTSNPQKGVTSQLANQLDSKPSYDGVTIEQMRGNPLYSRIDDIDKVGVAQKRIMETGNILRKSEFVRAFNKRMQHPNINTKF